MRDVRNRGTLQPDTGGILDSSFNQMPHSIVVYNRLVYRGAVHGDENVYSVIATLSHVFQLRCATQGTYKAVWIALRCRCVHKNSDS